MCASSLRILLYEYFCAGGGARTNPAPLGEARAMLAALVEDFSQLPGTRILTLQRPGTSLDLSPPHESRSVAANGSTRSLKQALEQVDAALIVAPERGGVLEKLTLQVEQSGVLNLGSSSLAVSVAADKWHTYRSLRSAGVPQPWSLVIRASKPISGQWIANRPATARRNPSHQGHAEEASPRSQWIVKPLDGYACLGLHDLSVGGKLIDAVSSARAHSKRAQVLLQERLHGTDASVSLLGDGKRAVALCVNRQRLRRGAHYEYLGGEVPLQHPQAGLAARVACDAARAIPGLRGYFGVDVLLDREGAWVVDVNPRLTTSYVAVRRVLRANPAAWILEAARSGRLPRQVRLSGRARFTLPCPSSSAGTSAASI